MVPKELLVHSGTSLKFSIKLYKSSHLNLVRMYTSQIRKFDNFGKFWKVFESQVLTYLARIITIDQKGFRYKYRSKKHAPKSTFHSNYKIGQYHC